MCFAHIRSSASTSFMHLPNTTTVPEQLHATLPGRNGPHACLTLYDICPHDSRSPVSAVRLRKPYLHHDLPPLPPAPLPRTIEYVDNRGRSIVETTRTSFSPLPESRLPQLIEFTNDKESRVSDTSHNTSWPQETAMVTSLGRPVPSQHSPVVRHVRESTATPPPLRSILKKPPSVPTIYLLSFSTDRTPTTRAFAALLNEHLLPHIPLRYTIDARSFLVPPTRICETYSGVAGIVQGEVLRDSRARAEIDHAVGELTSFVRQGGRETGLAVYCTAGTHRSVAIAELIALGVRDEVRRLGSKEWVKVVVRHVHRVRGVKDPY